MTFVEMLDQVRELLRSKGRVSYRTLKLQFHLDDDHIEGLKDEFIEAERVAVDENGKVLVWVGDGGSLAASPSPPQQSQTPASYTPQHLA